jgi:hypothetical protein
MALHGWAFIEAAKHLDCWSTSNSDFTEIKKQRRERERQREIQVAQKAQQRHTRIAARNDLHATERIFRETNERLGQLLRGATERSIGETDSCWAILATAIDEIREGAQLYRALAEVESGE